MTAGGLPVGIAAHLAFVGCAAIAAGGALSAALLGVVRRGPAGGLVRIAAAIMAVAGGASVVLAAANVSGIPAGAWGLSAATVVALAALGLTAVCLLLAWSAAEPRVAALAAVVGTLTGTGMVLQLLLYGAAPDPAAAADWELRRLSTVVTFASVEIMVLAAVGASVSLRHVGLVRVLHGVVFAFGAWIATAALGLTGGSTLKESAAVLLVLVAVALWLGWLALRTRPIRRHPLASYGGDDLSLLDGLTLRAHGLRCRLHRRMAGLAGAVRRLPSSPLAVLLVAALPVLLAMLALLFAQGDTARQAARIDLGGLEFTPALLVPFAFAPGLALVLMCPGLRARATWAVGLTMVVVGLLVAQREVGYTGVVVAVASVMFLMARGTWLQIALGSCLGLVGLAVAFELQPVMPQIPFTVRERLALWVSGAGLHRRGGHLLAADRVTYDLGGVWGIGVDTQPTLNLHATVNSLDTDFPLAVLGLFGGLPWLLAYITLVVALAVLLFDIARRQAHRGGGVGSRWRLPVLAGLATVPVASTAVNVSGGLTHLTPFAGVPAAFVSYGSFFAAGLLGLTVLFLVLGSREAVAAGLADEQDEGQTAPGLGEMPAAERPDPPDPWWSNPTWPGVRLKYRRMAGRLRLASVDASAVTIMLALMGLGTVWSQLLYERYTDHPKVHAHPSLTSQVRIRPLTPGVWEVKGRAPTGWTGILREGRTYRLDALELRYRTGRLEVVGACFPWMIADNRAIRIGFEGMMRPRLPGMGDAGQGLAQRLGASITEGNDLVLPLAPVWMRHLDVKRLPSGRFRVRAATPGARFVVEDEDGKAVSRPRGGEVDVASGWHVALADDPALHFRLVDEPGEEPGTGEVCLRNVRHPVFTWNLSRWRETLLGSSELLRRAPVGRTVDFEFAEDLKRAAEAGMVGTERDGSFWVLAWDRETRAAWDPLTHRRFRRLFRVRRLATEDGGVREVLHWIRGFYRDGSSRVRFRPDREAFARGWEGELLGLRDPFRFSRALPATATRKTHVETGRILDTRGVTLAALAADGDHWETTVPGAGAMLGYGFPGRGIYGGLIRSFRRLLMGRRVRPADAEGELTERILNRDAERIGADVRLTLDRELQEVTQAVVGDVCHNLGRLALDQGDLQWRPRGRAIVLGPEGEILAAAAYPSFSGAELDTVMDVVKDQQTRPHHAVGLDAWQRTTTVGSTAKIGLFVAAARRPAEHFAPRGEADLCIRAEDDEANHQRGCFVERGHLSSFRGETIEPVRNYGGSYFGGVVTVREVLVKSINTASAYLAGRLGLEGLRSFYELLEVTRPLDLLPDVIGLDPRFASDIERWPGDVLTAWRTRIGELPPGPDRWRTTYDVRLGLSGFSDFSLLHVALAGSIAARDGRHYRPFLVEGVRDLADGTTIDVEPPHPLQVIPVRMARHLKRTMVETVRRGTAYSLRRMVPRDVWEEMGGKTGTGETVRLQRAAQPAPSSRRKPRTQDHKFFVGFWPASSRNPYIVVTSFEYVSHLDKHVALDAFARIVDYLAGRERRPEPEDTSAQ